MALPLYNREKVQAQPEVLRDWSSADLLGPDSSSIEVRRLRRRITLICNRAGIEADPWPTA